MVNDFIQQTKLEAYRQHWEQIRHSENLRVSFTNFYALIVAGVLAFIFNQNGEGDYSILFWVLVVLSFLGLFLCVRIGFCSILGHRNRAKLFASELTGETKEKELDKYIPHWPLPWWSQIVSLRVIFIVLYIAGIVYFWLLASAVLEI